MAGHASCDGRPFSGGGIQKVPHCVGAALRLVPLGMSGEFMTMEEACISGTVALELISKRP
jgi:hypothetical protein